MGDIVDSDPLAEYEVAPDPTYADADPEAGGLPPEYSDSAILASTPRYDFLGFVFLSSELGTQTENKIAFQIFELRYFLTKID
jgi:hypothetical protein